MTVLPSAPEPTPMLFARQKVLLSLVHAVGGHMSNRDFQKVLFLYCNELGPDAPYEFVPYKYGAFSFTSYADRRKLVERGLLDEDDGGWRLAPAGQALAATLETTPAAKRFARTESRRGDALVADTYRRFPYYATRSEIAERVLAGDRDALSAIERARVRAEAPPLATLGYEGRTLEAYLNVLLRAGVDVLCDVRRNPISRKYGFSKKTLANACAGVGIRYEHLPELGIASDKRRTLDTQADYDALFEEYERESLPHETEAVARIAGWVKAGEHVALTCYEAQPHQCHRHCVAEQVERVLGPKAHARHL